MRSISKNETANRRKKSQRVVVAFRHSKAVETFLVGVAAKQNLYPTDIYRQIFNYGLTELYGLKIVGNEIVEQDSENQPQVSR